VVHTAVAASHADLCDVTPCSRVEITNPSDQQTSATVKNEKKAKQAAGNKPTAFLVLLPACFLLLPSADYSTIPEG
jgi:hypothetical protein